VITVLIVDDHPVVRDGLRGILSSAADLSVVGEAGTGAEAVTRCAELEPDVVLMDLRMPVLSGVEAIRQLRKADSPVRVLVLTTFDADTDVVPAIQAGADGYLLKDAPAEELLRAIRSAAQGEAVLAPSVAGRLMSRMAEPARKARSPLSPKEIQVLRSVASGRTNKEAAAELFVSETTVKTHLIHIYDKLGVRDRAAAVDAAHRDGLL